MIVNQHALSKLYRSALCLIGILLLVLSACSEEKETSHGKSLLPGRGEIIYSGVNYQIYWSSDFTEKLDIYLVSPDSRETLIAESRASSGMYNWQIPADLKEGEDYQLKYIPASGLNPGFSSGFFEIRNPGETGTFMDPRDGNIYPTIQIGDQRWMSSNFRYECEGSIKYNHNDEDFEAYGYLYTYEAAINNAPDGWHLPSDEEWRKLEAFMGMPEDECLRFGNRGGFAGTLLLSQGGSGFNIEAGGYLNGCVNKFGHKVWEAHIWSSSKTVEGKPILRVISEGTGSIIRLASICHKGSSVRYVKD